MNPIMIDYEKCIGCGLCVNDCPNAHSSIENSKFEYSYLYVEKAFEKLPEDVELIMHSDQRWQYQHKHYRKLEGGCFHA